MTDTTTPPDCLHISRDMTGQCFQCGDVDEESRAAQREADERHAAMRTLPPDIFPTAEQTEETWLRALRLLQANGANIEDMLADGARRMLAISLTPDAEDERAVDLGELEQRLLVAEACECDAVVPRDELARLLAQAREADRLRADILEVMGQRDEYHDAADELSLAIAPVEVIGEHTNLNNPWANALEQIEGQQQRHEALESALAPLLGSREPTPENVAEAVRHAARGCLILARMIAIGATGFGARRASLLALQSAGKATGALDCTQALLDLSSLETEADKWLSADAARSEPEGRE